MKLPVSTGEKWEAFLWWWIEMAHVATKEWKVNRKLSSTALFHTKQRKGKSWWTKGLEEILILFVTKIFTVFIVKCHRHRCGHSSLWLTLCHHGSTFYFTTSSLLHPLFVTFSVWWWCLWGGRALFHLSSWLRRMSNDSNNQASHQSASQSPLLLRHSDIFCENSEGEMLIINSLNLKGDKSEHVFNSGWGTRNRSFCGMRVGSLIFQP